MFTKNKKHQQQQKKTTIQNNKITSVTRDKSSNEKNKVYKTNCRNYKNHLEVELIYRFLNLLNVIALRL